MKIPAPISLCALFVFGALFTCPAHAQLDQILAPVADAPSASAGDQGAPSAPADIASAASIQEPAKSVRTLSADDLVIELQKQLTNYFGLKGDLKLTLMRGWQPIPLPGKDCDITVTDYPGDGVTSAFTVSFKVASGGIDVGEWDVTLRAQLWQSVWVTQTRLDRGQELDSSMLNAQKVDVLREKGTLLSDDIDPSGYDVAQGVAAGIPLSKGDITERPVIHRGDVVDVVATQGLMDIRMKALALEDGGVNALIKMRNLDSSKEFNAQILNENEVRVHF